MVGASPTIKKKFNWYLNYGWCQSTPELFYLSQVFLEYDDVDSASRARMGLNGRKFGGNQVTAVYYSEEKFSQGDYDE